MKNWIYAILLSTLVTFADKAMGQINSSSLEEAGSVPYDSLRIALEKMYDKDQTVRNKLYAAGFDLTVEEYAALHHAVYDKEQALPN